MLSETIPAAPPERIEAIDVPIGSLTPVRKRTARKIAFERLEANIRAVGLIEPLLVYRHKGEHFILDGYLRYQVLRDLGVKSAPCLILDNLDVYTPNRQVNYLSQSQRWGMIKLALRDVDEKTIKAALGLRRLRSDLSQNQRDMLCQEVLNRVQDETLAMSAASGMANVTHNRQREILKLADQAKDISRSFIRAQILRTPVEHRILRPNKIGPWNRVVETRKKLIDKLTDVEQHHDFYQSLYRQYAGDFVKLAIYARQIITTKEIKTYLAQGHADDLKSVTAIVQQMSEQTGRA